MREGGDLFLRFVLPTHGVQCNAQYVTIRCSKLSKRGLHVFSLGAL